MAFYPCNSAPVKEAYYFIVYMCFFGGGAYISGMNSLYDIKNNTFQSYGWWETYDNDLFITSYYSNRTTQYYYIDYKTDCLVYYTNKGLVNIKTATPALVHAGDRTTLSHGGTHLDNYHTFYIEKK